MTLLIAYYWKMFCSKLSVSRGAYRLLLGYCPLCNSDAPELYDCPICNGYHQASGDKWPPNQALKSWWWSEYMGAVKAWRRVQRMVLDSRLHRNAK